MTEFNITESLYIRVVTMDINGMWSRIGYCEAKNPEVVAKQAWAWAEKTTEMVAGLSIRELAMFLDLIALPDTDLYARLRIDPDKDDVRQLLIDYVKCLSRGC